MPFDKPEAIHSKLSISKETAMDDKILFVDDDRHSGRVGRHLDDGVDNLAVQTAFIMGCDNVQAIT